MKQNRDPEFCRAFVRQAKETFSEENFPTLQQSWVIDADEDHAYWEIKGTPETGYDIHVEISADEVTFYAQGHHVHYMSDEPLDDFIRGMLSRVREMLTPAMRIRERYSNGVLYRTHLENRMSGVWSSESSSMRVFWNWFGTKTEKFYINNVLPKK